MNRRFSFAVAGLATAIVSVAFAGPEQDHANMQLPPGFTQADMEACMQAATPGEQHAWLAQGVGEWHGKTTMWMGPDAPPMHSECKTVVKSVMDGRYFNCKTEGEMPGMGMFEGMGTYAFDNVSQQFQITWIDNCGTGIATGTGDLSSDGKTMTWVLKYNCPITKKPTTMREVQRITGKDTMTMEMYGIDPKSGKEFKMMEIVSTRKPGSSSVSSAN